MRPAFTYPTMVAPCPQTFHTYLCQHAACDQHAFCQIAIVVEPYPQPCPRASESTPPLPSPTPAVVAPCPQSFPTSPRMHTYVPGLHVCPTAAVVAPCPQSFATSPRIPITTSASACGSTCVPGLHVCPTTAFSAKVAHSTAQPSCRQVARPRSAESKTGQVSRVRHDFHCRIVAP